MAVTRIETLRNTIISLVSLIDNEEHLGALAALAINPNGGAAKQPEPLKPKQKQSKAAMSYPQHLYEPTKDYLTQHSWVASENRLNWVSEGTIFEWLRTHGKTKPSDTIEEVHRCLMKNSGLNNVFCGDGDKWVLRKYMGRGGPKLVA